MLEFTSMQQISDKQEIFQPLHRSNEYKEELKRAVKRTRVYAARALEASDVVIIESIQGAASSAGWRLNAARRV